MMVLCDDNVIIEYDRRRSGLPRAPLDMEYDNNSKSKVLSKSIHINVRKGMLTPKASESSLITTASSPLLARRITARLYAGNDTSRMNKPIPLRRPRMRAWRLTKSSLEPALEYLSLNPSYVSISEAILSMSITEGTRLPAQKSLWGSKRSTFLPLCLYVRRGQISVCWVIICYVVMLQSMIEELQSYLCSTQHETRHQQYRELLRF